MSQSPATAAEPGACDQLTTCEDQTPPDTITTATPDGWRVARTTVGDSIVVTLFSPSGKLLSRTTWRPWQ